MARRNRGIRGWRRVTSAEPCHFCAMLAGRGGVYSATTVTFEAHDSCSCTPEPVYAGEPDPPEVVALQREWQEVTAGHSGPDALRVWREHWHDRPAAPPSWAERAARAATGDQAVAAPRYGLAADRQIDALSRDERSSLREYKGQAYANINPALRREQGAPEWMGNVFPQLADIDTVMARSPLPADVLLHRGVSDGATVFGSAWSRNLAGAQWTEHAYLSASASAEVASTFAAGSGVVMRVLAPQGTRGVALSGANYESELLLDRGLRLRVVADSGPGSSPRTLDVEVIP